jgi:hypothetical protein
MIVDRRIHEVKLGRGADARAVLKELYALWESKLGPITFRIYRPKVASYDMVVWESEFENLAECDRLLSEFFALPEFPPLMARWNEARQAGGTREIWNLVE